MTILSAPWYNQAPYVASLTASSTANLPNRSGSATTITGLQAGQICQVGSAFYMCDDPTSGSAVWFLLPAQPKDPLGRERVQVVSTATATILPGIDRVKVTYAAAACTLTTSTVLAGHPIGTKFVIEKANTGAFKIVLTPDSVAIINGAAADATQDMVYGYNTATTAVSAAGVNDPSIVVWRDGALSWRTAMA